MGSHVTTRPPTRSPTLRERNTQDSLVEGSTVTETQSIDCCGQGQSGPYSVAYLFGCLG